MTNPNASPTSKPGAEPDRVDLASDASVAEWSKKLAVTEMQLKEAVSKVGDRATDVEMHLKGSRSTTNEERVDEAGAA